MSGKLPRPGTLPGPIDVAVQSGFRVVGDRADGVPPGTQLELPLRWCSLADPGPPPATIAIQPEPIQALVGHLPTPGGVVTAVTRIWQPGDTLRCRLCDHCTAFHDLNVCQVQVGFQVPVESGPDLSIRGLPWRGPERGD